MSNTKFPFPRLRFWLLNLFRPQQLNDQEALGYNNTQSAERTSGALYNAPTATPAGADVWLDPIAQMSPEPFLRMSEPLAQAHSMFDAARRRRAIQQREHAPTMHELPVMPRALRAFIDAQSNETPPEHAALGDAWLNSAAVLEDEGEPTEQVKALPASEQLRYWASRKMA